VLSDADKALYARQILLSELGLEGQQRLVNAVARIAASSDARAREVARAYLLRGGVGTAAAPEAAAVSVAVPDSVEVQRIAGDPALEGCAAWLAGAFAAVEAIKQAAGVGTPAALDPECVLSREVV